MISSDETWSVTRSNLWFSNIYDGERRDDTLPPVEESSCADRKGSERPAYGTVISSG